MGCEWVDYCMFFTTIKICIVTSFNSRLPGDIHIRSWLLRAENCVAAKDPYVPLFHGAPGYLCKGRWGYGIDSYVPPVSSNVVLKGI